MHLLRRIAAIAALAVPLAFATGVSAQETGTITGQVTDAADGRPLAGVQMVLAGTNLGTLTNANGRYIITRAPLGTQTVRAVLIGYSQANQEVNVTAGQPVVADFQLSTSAVNLEAIVVSAATGREQRLREIGTSVGTIEVEDLNPAPVTSVSDILGGRTEGVILQDVNGTTGTSQRIRIRGANSLSLSNEPLVFVDGVQLQTGTGSSLGVGGQEPSRLNDINPQDIANIEIIKGPAAAATYGTAAANGVILITTKRGTPGATQWEFFAETGVIDDITDYPTNFATLAIVDPSLPVVNDDGTFNTTATDWCTNLRAAAGICTQDQTFQFNTLLDPRTRMFSQGNRERYGASVRGGNDDVRYFISGQFEDETGVVFFNTNERVNLRANLDAALDETVDVSVSVGYTDNGLALNNNDNSIFSPIINGLLGYPNFIEPNPDVEGPNPANYGFGFNLNQLSVTPTFQDTDRFVASGQVRWRPTNWLSINANGGLDYAGVHNFETNQPGDLPIAQTWIDGFRTSRRVSSFNYTAIFSGTGTFSLTDDLQSTTTVGTQYDQATSRNTECFGSGLVQGTASCGTTSLTPFVDEDFFEIKTIGLYVQQELAFRDRIFLQGGVRGDKTSTFGTNLGFAYFPSAQLSWVLSEEDFFPELDFLSTFRVRGAWGQSGLRPGFRDAVTLFSPTAVALPSGDASGVALSNTGNALLEQETATEYEVGFQAGLFDERLAVDFTYYDRETEDALISRPLPGSLGLTGSVFENLGSIGNSGTELSLRLDVIQTEQFGLNLGFNNTTINNEILELGEGIEPIIFNRGLQRHEEGFTAGGFWQQPVTFNDDNGDGIIGCDQLFTGDPADGCEVTVGEEAEFIGPSLPTWQRSVFADVRLFNFITVSTLFEGRGGNFKGNDSEAFRCGFRSTRGCAAVADPNASQQEQAAYIADRFLGSAAGFVEEADFWRWRELSVALDMPSYVSDRVSALDGLRITLAGRNLATFTDYDGLDPETNETGGNSNFSNSEFNTQPPVRLFMVRFDYSF